MWRSGLHRASNDEAVVRLPLLPCVSVLLPTVSSRSGVISFNSHHILKMFGHDRHFVAWKFPLCTLSRSAYMSAAVYGYVHILLADKGEEFGSILNVSLYDQSNENSRHVVSCKTDVRVRWKEGDVVTSFWCRKY